jgi:hypothetical protein
VSRDTLPQEIDAERLAARAAHALGRPDAFLEPGPGGYLVRLTGDRRRRPALVIGEAALAALIRSPGLKPRPGGGWVLASRPADKAAPPPGKPGFIAGERLAADEQGRLVRRAANLGESPVAWLARRKDPKGRPWLGPAQLAAAERLREDAYRAGMTGRLTMAWDAAPRSSGARGPGLEPVEQARAAKDRLAAALNAMGPGLKEIVEQVCLLESPIEAAERSLDLPRRAGKAVLRLALDRLAAHYRIG